MAATSTLTAAAASAPADKDAIADTGPAAWPPPGSGAKDVPPRTPRFPLKTARTIFTDSEIATAKDNIAQYSSAAKVAEGVRQIAEPYLAWDDADLARLCTPASVPRAFDVGSSIGCPKCGKTIHEKFGTYPWLVDPKMPFKLTCPVDGSVYPDNDYDAYLRSDFKTKTGWDNPCVDDGWGWLNPANGERYWFVAHYNHRVWMNNVGIGCEALGRAYLLTGDRRYAHKAGVLLYHTATVYPAMDHEHQSRYGLMMAQRGQRYPGKIVNLIWETGMVREFAAAYDAVWETLDGDTALQAMTGRKGPEIRAHIEANLIEDAVDAYYEGKIKGNFGMHQIALANLAVARQHGDNEKWLGGLLTRTGADAAHTGVEYALYNLIYREGIPSETSPGYNFSWVANLTALHTLMDKGGHGFYTNPRMRRLNDGVLDIVNCGTFTPDLGDTGSVYGYMEGRDADVFQAAYRATRDERYARFLASFGASGAGGFRSFASLLLPPVGLKDMPAETANGAALPPLPSRVFDGYGLGILTNPADTTSLSVYYGFRAGHGHFDRLGFELFAAGQPIMPDLGYPDAMNDFVPGIYTWSKNTISHNTVVVDAAKQPENVSGAVRLFADGDFARILDIDAAGTYPLAKTYRRALLMVDRGTTGSYYVDIFDVAGGNQHDYSLHGPPGDFVLTEDADWGAPEPGTLAGKDVPLGKIYDDPTMGASGYAAGYGSYGGSGFQHLYNVRRRMHAGGDDAVAEWRHEKDKSAGLRIRILSQPGQELITAQAHVSPVKFPRVLNYLIARRTGSDVRSRFISLLEPFKDTPILTACESVPLSAGEGTAIRVVRKDGLSDILLYDPACTAKRLSLPGGGEVATDAHAAVVTLDGTGAVRRVFFAAGSALTVHGKTHQAAPAISGSVMSVAPERGEIRIRLDNPAAGLGSVAALSGRLAHFSNDRGRRVSHPLRSARVDGDAIVLTAGDDLRIGRAHVARIDEGGTTLVSDVALPLGSVYRGATVCSADFVAFYPVIGVANSAIRLSAPLLAGDAIRSVTDAIRAGADAYLLSVGPGDRVTLPSIFTHIEAGV